ncbi:MAG: hypothetical protein Q9227_005592 [Pyrenula ochraceoflavens]
MRSLAFMQCLFVHLIFTLALVHASIFQRAKPSSTAAARTTSVDETNARSTDIAGAASEEDENGKHWLHPHRLPGEFGPKHELTPHRLDIVVYKATEDDGEVRAGDYYVETSSAFRSKLQTLAQEAGCSKKRARDPVLRQTCNVRQVLNSAIEEGGPADIELAEWPQDLTLVGEEVATAVAELFPHGVDPYASMVFVAGLAFLSVTGSAFLLHSGKSIFPLTAIGRPKYPVKGSPGEISPTSSTTQSCPTSTDMPLCHNTKVCDGQASTTCAAEGEYHDCSCILFPTVMVHPGDVQLIDAQQEIMAEITEGPPEPTSTSNVFCEHGADAGCDQGRLPCEWCDCTTTGKGWNQYSVNSGDGNNLCPYTDSPGTKITWSSAKPTPTSSTKCPRDHCPVYYYGGLPRDTIIAAAEKYCKDYLTAGRRVVNNWPSGCAWDVGDDKYGISFTVGLMENCHANQQNLLTERCVAGMHHAIDDCNTSSSIKCMGTYNDVGQCIYYHFNTQPKDAGSPKCQS